MSILLSASRCTAELEQGEHLFKISDHSLHRGMGVGQYINSSSFAVGGHEWCLRYYPDGRLGPTGDGKDSIALVLELVERDPNADQARVSCTISFFVWATKRFSSLVAFTEKIPDPNSLVGSHTLDRATMEASGYVVDDRLTFKCALTIIKEPYVIEEDGSHVEVPPSDITEQLGKLVQAKEGSDVTFEVQGEEFPAHKLVLAMRSPVFKALMREKDSNRIVIDNMQPAIFKVLLHFIYTDSVPPMDEEFDAHDKKEVSRHLLGAADRYGIERLKLMCENILCKELDVQSVATTFAFADRHSCSGLKDACIRFVASCTKIDDLVASTGYTGLKRSCPGTVMEMWEKAIRFRKT